MKRFLSTVFYFALIMPAFSQTPYTINAEVTSYACPSDKKFSDFEQFYKIYDSMYDENWRKVKEENELPEKDQQYLQKMREKYEYPEDSAPWQILGPGCSWYCGAHYEMNASSTLPAHGENNYDVNRLWDDDVRTAWVEGAKGYGIGEYITFDFPEGSPTATRCDLVTGYSKNEKTWKNNSRVKALNIYENDKLAGIVNLKDTRCMQTFELKNHRPNGEAVVLKFVITEVYKGDRYDDTAISELIFDGTGVHCLGKGTLIAMADGTEKAIEEMMSGDNILSYNAQTKEMTTDTVKFVCTAGHSELIRITLSNGESIVATEDHPFLSEKGWVSYSPKKTKQYKRYKQVEIKTLSECKSLLFYENGNLISKDIRKVEFISDSQQTYTLELGKDGDFIANGFVTGQE